MNSAEKLERALGLPEATALNMIDMVGIGPFIVIPFVLQKMPGGYSLLAWVAGACLALLDGCIWAELGAAMPQAGGSYTFLREEYGPGRWGRLMSFLLIWQTLFQAPLVLASGALGFGEYSTFLLPKQGALANAVARIKIGHTPYFEHLVAAAAVIFIIFLLYRHIGAVGKISIAIWTVVIGTIIWLIYGGATHFDAQGVFEFPAGRWDSSWLFIAGLGGASVQTVYTYLGYYNVCNLGGEMKQPQRNIPRAIFISILGITALYLAMQMSILSVVPWREAQHSSFVVSVFVERAYGLGWARVATGLILIIAFGSLFSATLGYSRVSYAAAIDGNFFSAFGRIHPTKKFPHVSLLALGAAAFVFSLLFRLNVVIRAILAMRCLIQFIGQAVGLIALHRRWPSEKFPFRMWLYPIPAVIAILGWGAIFVSTGVRLMTSALIFTIVGAIVYLARARTLKQWPFQETAA